MAQKMIQGQKHFRKYMTYNLLYLILVNIFVIV
jgi:hypothetical protein